MDEDYGRMLERTLRYLRNGADAVIFDRNSNAEGQSKS
jgi:hypothetical protein